MATPIIVDTNLLVLVTVGLTNISYISKHKRLKAYDETDFRIVTNTISEAAEILFVPNVISETSNMIRYLNAPICDEVSLTLSAMIRESTEHYISSDDAILRSEHIRLGVTDAVLLSLSERGGTLFTDDLDLYLAAVNSGLSAINYNHLRQARLDFR